MSADYVPSIDAHVHFWDPSILPYPWLGSVPPLQRAFLPDDYPGFPSGDGPSVDAVIVVEANVQTRRANDEVDWIERFAPHVQRIAGIVAYVDLLDEISRDARLEQCQYHEYVVGVRHNIQGHPPGFALQPAFAAGVQAVGRFGFPFDLCATASQLAEVTELVKRCPDVRFVLDHCGKPPIRDGGFAKWSQDVAALAAAGRVYCKLSGLMTEASEGQRTHELLVPYLAHAIDTFGIDQVVYGSDWPVCTLAGDVTTWRSFVSQSVGLDQWLGDRDKVFGGNAIDLYGFTWPRLRR